MPCKGSSEHHCKRLLDAGSPLNRNPDYHLHSYLSLFRMSYDDKSLLLILRHLSGDFSQL